MATRQVTKLQVVEYYLAVEDGIMRALATGPPPSSAGRRACATASRWPPGPASTATRSTRSGCPRARPTCVESARITFPSGREAEELCPTEIAAVAWAAQMGTITFHPWPVRRARRRPARRAAHRPRPAAGHRLRRRGAGRAGGPGPARRARHGGLPEDERQPGRARLRPDRAALGLRRRAPRRDRLRPRAGAAYDGSDDGVVEGGARREHLRRLQPELPRPHHRQRLLAAAESRGAGLDTGGLGGARGPGPADPQPAHRPAAARRAG